MAGLNGKKIQLNETQKTILKEQITKYYLKDKVNSTGLLVRRINQKKVVKNPGYIKKKWYQGNRNRPPQLIRMSFIEQILGFGYVVEGTDIDNLDW